jgi:hypothetical protein
VLAVRGAQNPASWRQPCPRAQEIGGGAERARRERADEGELPRASGRRASELGRFCQPASAGGDRDGRLATVGTSSPSRSSSGRRVSARVCTATIRRRPPRRGQCRTSTPKTRVSNAAQSDRAGGLRPRRRGAPAQRGLIGHSSGKALLDSLVVSLSSARLLLLVNYRPEYQHAWGGKISYARAATEQIQRRRGMVIPHVFHRAGRPIRDFRKAWQNACRDAGCPGRV